MDVPVTATQRSRSLSGAAGGMLLAYFATMIIADSLGRLGFGSPGDVYRVIRDDPLRFRFALVASLVSALLFLSTAIALRAVLARKGPEFATAFLVLNAVGTAVHCASLVPLMAALLLAEREALIAIAAYKTGFASAQLFFGAWLFPLGALILVSKAAPRLLGTLLLMDGAGVLLWFFQSFLLPDCRAIIYPGLVISFVAEFSLAAWLAAKGVRLGD